MVMGQCSKFYLTLCFVAFRPLCSLQEGPSRHTSVGVLSGRVSTDGNCITLER